MRPTIIERGHDKWMTTHAAEWRSLPVLERLRQAMASADDADVGDDLSRPDGPAKAAAERPAALSASASAYPSAPPATSRPQKHDLNSDVNTWYSEDK